jgi:hypothetical protein
MYGLCKESGSRFARWPTHAMRLHEWGTRVYGPPATIYVWATRLKDFLYTRTSSPRGKKFNL